MALKLNYWFAAVISNMQFGMEGGLTNIHGFLQLSDNVGMFYSKNKSILSIE